MDFKVGDRVERIENREIVGATILSIQQINETETIVELQYDEGGSGWWPINCIVVRDA
jgi:hypothetical protein